VNYFLPTKLNNLWTLNAAVLVLAVGGQAQGQPKAQAKSDIVPPTIPADQFGKLHGLIKPQPGELRFHEIPWLLDVWTARKKAAAEGKPILVWAGSGGPPIGGC
jgi:hypothetical protein